MLGAESEQPIPSEINFESYADAWLKQNLTRYKKSFHKTLEMFVNTYLIPAFGKLPIEEITGPAVNEWIGKVRLRDGSTPSRKTLRHLVTTLQILIGRKFGSEVRYPSEA